MVEAIKMVGKLFTRGILLRDCNLKSVTEHFYYFEWTLSLPTLGPESRNCITFQSLCTSTSTDNVQSVTLVPFQPLSLFLCEIGRAHV